MKYLLFALIFIFWIVGLTLGLVWLVKSLFNFHLTFWQALVGIIVLKSIFGDLIKFDFKGHTEIRR